MPAKPDISLTIAELLLEHDEVVVNGIGTFFTEKKEPSFDSFENAITPPSRALNFRDSFQSNDSLLIQSLETKFNLHESEAKEAVTTFTKEVQRDLLLSRDCNLPGLGVLNFTETDQIELGISYLDLDASFFGLSKLNYQPIIREPSQNPVVSDAVKILSNDTHTVLRVKDEKKSKGWSLKKVFLNKLVYFFIFLLSFGWFIITNNAKSPVQETAAFKPVPTRFNVAPVKDKIDPQFEEKVVEEILAVEPEQLEDQHYEEIMLYALSDPDNIEKALTRIEKLGYDPILSNRNSLTLIQIKLYFSDQEDFESKFDEIKTKLTQRAYIITE